MIGTILFIFICQHKMWQPCCYAMTRVGSRLRSLQIGLISHLHFHQHNHGILNLQIGANQGHTNQVTDPFSIHHPLTFEESMCMGWIFQVSSADNRRSIEQRGLLREPGRGKSGRDSVHFMFHNDNSPGYVRMAEGTTAPKQYRNPIYCVLLPRITHDFKCSFQRMELF